MKKSNLISHLQQQYNKLQARINKAIQSGKFSSYTAYKQQQLQARLQRYALQLRQLAKGVAVCAALGVALPASAQYVPPGFLMHDGATNPLEALVDEYTTPVNMQDAIAYMNMPYFYDIDGDGDLDIFLRGGDYYTGTLNYHENIGTASSPQFSATPSANPLPSTPKNIFAPVCADIDNDGDLDCFATHEAPYYDSTAIYYFENQGTATAPSFVIQNGAANPLDSINIYFGQSKGAIHENIFFIDIDADNDLDVMYHGSMNGYQSLTGNKILFFENIGTISSPVFRARTGAMNPFPQYTPQYKLNFADMDKDGDWDLFKRPTGGSSNSQMYFENTGDSANAIFPALPSGESPLDSIPFNFGSDEQFTFVDMDNDGDLDVFAYMSRQGDPNSDFNFVYYENLDTTITTNTTSLATEDDLTIYPNPTTGILMFNRPMIGQLRCYNQLGQVFVDKRLLGDMWVDLSALEKGVYFMAIETEKMRIRKKVVIE